MARRDFLNGGMTYAVEVGIEDAVINGPAAGLIVGFLNTSGVLVQPLLTGDLLGTLANAITLVEKTGVPVTGIVMSFNEYINRRDLDELSRLMTDDHVLLIPPIARSRARRRVSKLGEDLSPPSGLSQSPRARSVIE